MTTTGNMPVVFSFGKEKRMKAVKWCSNDFIVRRESDGPDIDRVIAAAHDGVPMRIDIEPCSSDVVLGSPERSAGADGQFREGCIKAVEAHIWPLAQKSGVLAEIHRRLDRLSEKGYSDRDRASALASVYDFAGAWALAARLIRSGLRVVVIEGGKASPGRYDQADVEIVLSVGPAWGD
jgi:hypothetical protein